MQVTLVSNAIIENAPSRLLDKVRELSTANILKRDATGGYGRKTIRFYREEDGGVIVAPRGIVALLPALCAGEVQSSYFESAVRQWPARTTTLFDDQKLVAEKLKESLQGPSHSGLLFLPPSSGKTMIGCHVAADLKQRTLIIAADSKMILRGWKGEISRTFSIKEDDIGIVCAGVCTIGDHFTVALFQSLRTMDEPTLIQFFAHFGTVIVDEVHVVPAESYFGLMSRCAIKYRVGLTASERRKDGLECVMHLLFGQTAHVSSGTTNAFTATTCPIVEARVFRTGVKSSLSQSRRWSNYLNALCSNVGRNNLILRQVLYDMDRGRVPLVVCARVEQAVWLFNRLRMKRHGAVVFRVGNRSGKTKVVAGRGKKRVVFLPKGPSDDVLIEGFRTGKYRCWITTIKFLEKGVSVPQLSALHICAPIGFDEAVIQLFGRVRRRFGMKKAYVREYLDGDVENKVRFKRASAQAYNKYGINIVYDEEGRS